MKTLNLLLMKLGKRAWFQVLIVLELAAALTLFMMVLGKVEYYAQPKKALDPAKLKNCFMYSHMELHIRGTLALELRTYKERLQMWFLIIFGKMNMSICGTQLMMKWLQKTCGFRCLQANS